MTTEVLDDETAQSEAAGKPFPEDDAVAKDEDPLKDELRAALDSITASYFTPTTTYISNFDAIFGVMKARAGLSTAKVEPTITLVVEAARAAMYLTEIELRGDK